MTPLGTGHLPAIVYFNTNKMENENYNCSNTARIIFKIRLNTFQ
jgi:hypothetical protein